MPKKRMLLEFGMGTSLRRADYTSAAERAIRDALWHNSISLAEYFNVSKDDMLIDVEVAVQKPEEVDPDALLAVFPYGSPTVSVTHGGLDVPKPDGSGTTIIANAAISVSFDVEDAQ